MVEGLIRLEEGNPREARELLERARKMADGFRHSSPEMGSLADQIRAGLALAHAAEGDLEAARRHYKLARPRLVALRIDHMIERCEKAIGPPG